MKKLKQRGGKNCAVVGCTSNSMKMIKWNRSVCEIHSPLTHSECACLQPYKMHRFPLGSSAASKEELKEWLRHIKRKDFIPNANSRVCSLHFRNGRPTVRHPDTVQYMGYKNYKPLTPERPCPKRGTPIPPPTSTAMEADAGEFTQHTADDSEAGKPALLHDVGQPDWAPTQRKSTSATASSSLQRYDGTQQHKHKIVAMVKKCAVIGCSNSSEQLDKWYSQCCQRHGLMNKVCGCSPPFKLFTFPSELQHPKRYEKWIQLVNRRKEDGSHERAEFYDRVCSVHFKEGQPTAAWPDPTEHLGYDQFPWRAWWRRAEARLKESKAITNEELTQKRKIALDEPVASTSVKDVAVHENTEHDIHARENTTSESATMKLCRPSALKDHDYLASYGKLAPSWEGREGIEAHILEAADGVSTEPPNKKVPLCHPSTAIRDHDSLASDSKSTSTSARGKSTPSWVYCKGKRAYVFQKKEPVCEMYMYVDAAGGITTEPPNKKVHLCRPSTAIRDHDSLASHSKSTSTSAWGKSTPRWIGCKGNPRRVGGEGKEPHILEVADGMSTEPPNKKVPLCRPSTAIRDHDSLASYDKSTSTSASARGKSAPSWEGCKGKEAHILEVADGMSTEPPNKKVPLCHPSTVIRDHDSLASYDKSTSTSARGKSAPSWEGCKGKEAHILEVADGVSTEPPNKKVPLCHPSTVIRDHDSLASHSKSTSTSARDKSTPRWVDCKGKEPHILEKSVPVLQIYDDAADGMSTEPPNKKVPLCRPSTAIRDHDSLASHSKSTSTSARDKSTPRWIGCKGNPRRVGGKEPHILEKSVYTSTCAECEEKEASAKKMKGQLKKLQSKLKRHKAKSKQGKAAFDTCIRRVVLRSDRTVNDFTGIESKEKLKCLHSSFKSKVPKRRFLRCTNRGYSQRSSPLRKSKSILKKPGPARFLTSMDEFMLVLLKLRLALNIRILASLFNVLTSTASLIVDTWVKFLAQELKPLIFWPDRTKISSGLPKSLKASSKNIRCTIDLTEVLIERPNNSLNQTATWSEDRHDYTAKFLVAIAPNGMISFLSKAWGGRASDVLITRESGFLDLIERGDVILADRGSSVGVDLYLRHATLHVPPSSAEAQHQSPMTMAQTVQNANARIHVEQCKDRLKLFAILREKLPIDLVPLIDDIVTVCAALVNLRRPLVQ